MFLFIFFLMAMRMLQCKENCFPNQTVQKIRILRGIPSGAPKVIGCYNIE